jgi:hypothetical protein
MVRVMMGIGQVVTLRVPADKLREVNRVIESSAWGGYRTEFYPTYDYKPVWNAMPGIILDTPARPRHDPVRRYMLNRAD